jgi:hypothetical protein
MKDVVTKPVAKIFVESVSVCERYCEGILENWPTTRSGRVWHQSPSPIPIDEMKNNAQAQK